ncbi:PAS domain S-box protein [Spirosoma sp.]|uniref:PAS domain S-box protein n=1 Tax=Spirosoma sp. TaxID=1899569 RepID=UPI0026355E3B|nr:PAS domain S-box protein [Spirosoma sp.]MCX6217842.1 PAS domain S-box protein [Spirosoma sp.]
MYLEGVFFPDNKLADLRIGWASSGELTGTILSEFISAGVLSSLCFNLAQGDVACLNISNDDCLQGTWQIVPFKEGYLATLQSHNTSYNPENTISESSEELLRRLEYRRIFNGLTSALINLPFSKLDEFLLDALEQMGRYTQVDRCYVFRYSASADEMSCTHEWSAAGISPQQELLQVLPVSLFPWWHQKMVRGETICLYSLEDLPAEAQAERDILADQQILSLLVIPIMMEQRPLGFIGFDAVTEARHWNSEDVELLETFSQLLVNTLKRFSHEQSIIAFSRRESIMNLIHETLLAREITPFGAQSQVLQHLYTLVPAELMAIYNVAQEPPLAVATSWLISGNVTSEFDTRYPETIPLVNCPEPERAQLLSAAVKAGRPCESVCCIPIQQESRLLGYLLIADPRRHLLTQDDLALLQRAAYLLADFRVRKELVEQLQVQANQLTETNQLLSAIVDSTPAGLALFSPQWQNDRIYDFTYRFTNPANVRLTGRSLDQMRDNTLLTLFPEINQIGLFDKLAQTALTGQAQHFDEYVRHDGMSMWGYFNLIPIGPDVLFTVQDITPQKEAEELLRHQNELLERQVELRANEIRHLNALQKAIINYAALGFAATDAQGIIQLINPALEVMTGYKAHELIGKVSPGALRAPQTHQRLIQELTPHLDDPTLEGDALITAYVQDHTFLQRENTLQHKDGHLLPVLSTVSGLYDEQGVLLGYVDFVTDISVFKQAQETAKRAYHRLQLAADTAGLGIWEYDLATEKVSLDEQMQRICGIDNQHMPLDAELFSNLIHPADRERFQQAKAHALAYKLTSSLNFRLLQPSGQLVYGEMRMQPLLDEHQQPLQLIGVVQDRTAQRQTELALQRNKEQYLALVNNLHEIVFQMDLTGSFTFLNNAWTETIGYPLADSIGQSILSFLSPADHQVCSQLITQLVSREIQICQKTVAFIAQNGETKIAEVDARLLTDAQELPIGITGTFRDVTEQNKATDALRQSEQRFKAIFNSTFQMIGLLCPQGTILEMNDTACLASGKSMDELAGQYLWETYCWQLSPAIWQKCRAAVTKAAGGEPVNYETNIWLAGQTVVTIDFSVRPLFNDAGEVVLLIVEGHDLSSYKQMQQALQESEQRFREIAEKVDSLLWIRESGSPRFSYVNPMYERLTGRACESLYEDPTSFLDFVVEEDRPILLQLLMSNQPYDGPTYLRARIAGEIRWFEIRGFFTKDATGKVVRHIGVGQDVTSQMENKQVLEAALEREQALNKLKSLFVSMASHQFRTPLMTIQSSSELIEFLVNQDNADQKPAVQRHLHRIRGEVGKLTSILADILLLGQSDSGKICMQAEQVNLLPYITQIRDDYFSTGLGQRRVLIQANEQDYWAAVDRKLMSHVLQNLLTNATKYSKGDPLIRLTQTEQTIQIEVIDDGIGIPAGELSHLFDSFFRASNARQFQGTGLGLSIARQFVELHNGTIAVQSEAGKGTTFIVTLPAGEPSLPEAV